VKNVYISFVKVAFSFSAKKFNYAKTDCVLNLNKIILF
jgi:hypothetical protein